MNELKSLWAAFRELKNICLQKLSFLTKHNFSKPSAIYFPLNHNCNCRCVMCDLWKMPNQEIPFENIKNILVSLARWSPGSRIQFSGGEPLLRKDIFDILELAVSLGFRAGIVTNGFLINPDAADRLMSIGLFNVNISIDSMVPEKNDYARGLKGAHAMAVKAVDNLAAARKRAGSRTKIIIKAVISRINMDGLVDIIRFVKDNGLDGVLFQPLQRNIGSAHDPEWHRKSDLRIDDIKSLDRAMTDLVEMKKNTNVILNSSHNLRLIKEYFKDPSKKVVNECLSAYANIFVLASGDVCLCAEFGPIGNIYKDPDIEKMWKSENAKRMRERMVRCSAFCLNTCNERRTLYEYYRIFKHFFGF